MTGSSDVSARLLKAIWQEIRALDESSVGNYPAAGRAIESGAASQDLVRAMRHSSYEMAFRLLFLLSAEHSEEANDDATTGWTLVEADLLDSGDAIPNGGESLDFLHERLLTADPAGLEGQDFLA